MVKTSMFNLRFLRYVSKNMYRLYIYPPIFGIDTACLRYKNLTNTGFSEKEGGEPQSNQRHE